LDFEVAQPLIKFRSIAEHKGSVDFDDVLNIFVKDNRCVIGFEMSGPDRAVISFAHDSVELPVFTDPATDVKYFFCDVPVSFINNDKEIQPRVLMQGHVRKLALDFLERPVHEPSNCRLVIEGSRVARLLQFDGQHKATAQILIGRRKVPTKIYIEPSIDMLQGLVIKIQQEIKKQPLTRSETLAKIGDVMGRYLAEYQSKAGPRSERGFIQFQRKEQQKHVKDLYLQDLMRIVFYDEENKLAEMVRPGILDAVTTDKVIIEKIISPLLHKEMLEVDLDSAPDRDIERRNMLFVFGVIADCMFPPSWNSPGSAVQKRRAENFFYQGSIGWWMGEFLLPGLQMLQSKGPRKPLLTEEFDEAVRGRVQKLIETICSLPVWSTDDETILKAMRSNTIKNMEEACPNIVLKTVMSKVLE
jgi:hypothetical protein